MDALTGGWPYVAGYAFSILGGWGVAKHVLSRLRPDPVFRDTTALGWVESFLYTTSWLLDGAQPFVGFWLTLKTVKQWEFGPWNHEAQLRFNTYLIGSGISLGFAITGAEIINWLRAPILDTSNFWIPVLLLGV